MRKRVLPGILKKAEGRLSRVFPMLCAFLFFVFSIFYSAEILVKSHGQEAAVYAKSHVVTQVAGVARTLPKGFSLKMPENLTWRTAVFTKEKLHRGLLLLIDPQHPVPSAMPAPNSVSVAAYGKASIATRAAHTVLNLETIEALIPLFRSGLKRGYGDWTVFAGTRSNEQQLNLQLEQLAVYAKSHPLVTAAAMAAKGYECPGCSEHQTGYALDIRLCGEYNAPPDSRPLADSRSGQYLLNVAWQYGFIHRYTEKKPHPIKEEAYHFRYVGRNHAELMRLLQMSFEEYLAFLREKEQLSYYEDGQLKYVVLCGRTEGDFLTKVPDEAMEMEASADNTGYAIVLYRFTPPHASE